ncbi:MAG: competence type IV pilus minor pilin ComGF [Thomasclavelia sp.]|nr:competence type IV pilus minor pilin ComGF [Thomasclavelia sp.]
MLRRVSYKYNNKGFTLIEVLFSLFITLLIVINIVSITKVLNTPNRINTIDTSYSSGLHSLSRYLIDAKDINYGESLLFKNSKDEDCEIKLDNNRIVMTPGHIIFLRDVDDCSFIKKNNLIYIKIKINAKNYSFIIGSDFQKEVKGNE